MSLAIERLQTGKGVIVHWILSHAGIEGNELADKEAEKHSKLPPTTERVYCQTLSNVKRKVRKTKWQLEWQRGSPPTATQTCLDLGLQPTSRAKSLPERFKSGLLQLDQAMGTLPRIEETDSF